MYRQFYTLLEIVPRTAVAKIIKSHCRAEPMNQMALHFQESANRKIGIPPTNFVDYDATHTRLSKSRQAALKSNHPDKVLYWIEIQNDLDPTRRCSSCVCR